jgi:hypothetical protein
VGTGNGTNKAPYLAAPGFVIRETCQRMAVIPMKLVLDFDRGMGSKIQKIEDWIPACPAFAAKGFATAE